MTRIIGISGSLRRGSFNTALLRAAGAVAPSGVDFVAETVHGIPLYDGDVESTEGIPPRVAELKDRVASASGLVLATPEYNNSIPGVFKNAIDWLSRPGADIPRVFGGKPVAIMGASPGGFGTVSSQIAWLTVLRALGTKPWFGPRLLVPRANAVFDASGNLTDEELREKLRQFLAGFVAFIGG
jgi:NAD(P)H-dependent FMN reductase